MTEVSLTVPIVSAMSAVFAAGALWFQVRAIARALSELGTRVEKLADENLRRFEDRLTAIERWASGHEKQAEERWSQVHPKRDGE